MAKNKHQRSLFIKPAAIVSLFFIVYLLIGLWLYKDYGLSWDEETNRITGAISALYINGKFNYRLLSRDALAAKQDRIRTEDDIYWDEDPNSQILSFTEETLLTHVERDHGPFFELILIAMEALFNLEDSRDVHLTRHFFTFLLFFVSVWFFYLLTTHRFNNWIVGLLGASFLILSPRIFADSFYNSKDLAFLSLFIIATYSLIRFLNNPSVPNAALHAATNAASIDIRIVGVVIPAVTFLFITIDVLKSSSIRAKLRDISPSLLVYIFLLPCLTILFWPYLWENPIHNFVQAFRDMSRFRFNEEMLYLGKYISSTSVPWHYVPVWIIVTTPLFYFFCFLVGLYYLGKFLLKNRLQLYTSNGERQDCVNLAVFFLPIIAVIFLHAVLYDGWRHLYFVYPAFLSISVKGLVSLNESIGSWVGRDWRIPVRGGLLAALGFSFATTGYFMVKYHPHQQVYFNILAGRNVRGSFELDYWGLSYRQGLEYVLRNDSASVINVNTANFPGRLNAKILKREERERLRFVPLKDATYFLGDFRHHPQDYPLGGEFYSINVNRARILAVRKMR
jgi:hypothetical protein